jgi:hypothetical protein
VGFFIAIFRAQVAYRLENNNQIPSCPFSQRGRKGEGGEDED